MIPKFSEFLRKKWHLVLYFIAMLLYLTSAITIKYNWDSTYYLHLTQLISRGYKPFVDLAMAYTPLTFYLLVPVKLLFGNYFTFTVAVILLHCFTFSNALLIYKLCRIYDVGKAFAHIGAVSFLFLNIPCDSCYYMLEPYVVFFGLLSLYIYSRYCASYGLIILAGMSAALSLFSKQYGLGYIVLLITVIVLHNGKNYKKTTLHVGCVLVGFLGCIGSYIALFRYLTNDYQFLYTFSSQGYNNTTAKALALTVLIALQLSPCIFITPFVWKYCEYQKKQLVIFAVLGLIGFSGALWFGPYKHYLMLIVPFMSMLTAVVLQSIYFKNERLFIVLVTLPVSYLLIGVVTLILTCLFDCYNYYKRDSYGDKLRIALVEKIGHDKKTYLIMDNKMPLDMYFKADILPAGMSKRGVQTCGFEGRNISYMMQIAEDAKYICVSIDTYNELNQKREFSNVVAIVKQEYDQPEIIVKQFYLFSRK